MKYIIYKIPKVARKFYSSGLGGNGQVLGGTGSRCPSLGSLYPKIRFLIRILPDFRPPKFVSQTTGQLLKEMCLVLIRETFLFYLLTDLWIFTLLTSVEGSLKITLVGPSARKLNGKCLIKLL